MPSFQFRAAAVGSGSIETGIIEAASLADAQLKLKTQRLTPISLVPMAVASRVDKGRAPIPTRLDAGSADTLLDRLNKSAISGKTKKTVDAGDKLNFTSELAILLKAGLPLDRAIKVQIDSAPEGPNKQLLEELLGALKGGKSLSAALDSRADLFGTFYISMIKSGEASGHLAEVLAQLGGYLERSKNIRSSVISALIYPAILAVVAVIAVFVMLGFVVPEFEALFEDMGDTLPMLTQVIVWLGDWVGDWWWMLVALSCIGFAVLRRWIATDAGRQWLDIKLLNLPLSGQILLKFEVARFSRTLGTLLQNGVAMLKATDIAVGTVSNCLVRASLEKMAPEIKRGGRLSQAMDSRIFPPVAQQMVRVGEESGSLDRMLLELAALNEDEVEASIKRALTLLEPALILGMGAVIAFIIMGILMGILSVNTLVV